MSHRTLTEHALHFGDDGGLFGILTEPTLPSADEASPLFLFLNAGQIHRVGPYRMHVRLARILAGMGVRSLRIDLSGRGDSVRRTDLAGASAVADDFARVVDGLEARLGPQRIVLVGLCSGADDAIRLAVSDARVAGLFLLDPYCPVSPEDAGPSRPASVDVDDAGDEEGVDQLSLRNLPTLDEMRAAIAAVLERGGRVVSVFTDYAAGYYDRPGRLGDVLGLTGHPAQCIELHWPDADHTFSLEVHRMRLTDPLKTLIEGGSPQAQAAASPAAAPPASAAPSQPARGGETADRPSGALEQTVAAVWSELLGIDEIGRDDNFFDLGGHSLLAQKAVARVEKLTGVRMDHKRLATESLAQVAAALQSAGPRIEERSSLAGRLLKAFRKG
jgi:hypothetical protein